MGGGNVDHAHLRTTNDVKIVSVYSWHLTNMDRLKPITPLSKR